MLEQPLSNPVQSPSLYEQDFYQWTQEMAIALRAGRVSALDWKNLAEEIESLGQSDRRALESRLVVLLLHLLKWRYQSEYRTGSWKATISEQRRRIRVLLEDSPSLKPYLLQCLENCFKDGRRQASDEANQALEVFPQVCPFLEAEILDDEFLPD
ncbi:MAG: DUF29 domain-containing protein [Cyanobacteria bacterium CAN_BIN43]|jgi:hypothetical protein|nr:DUF29 domain-containing protein [Cyanobacteria bacterium CAN_BIN43]